MERSFVDERKAWWVCLSNGTDHFLGKYWAFGMNI